METAEAPKHNPAHSAQLPPHTVETVFGWPHDFSFLLGEVTHRAFAARSVWKLFAGDFCDSL